MITTFPFGKNGSKPLELMMNTGWDIIQNPFGRRIKPGEVADIIQDFDGVIAGTETYDENVLETAKRLKVISRVGVGLDNVPLKACKKLGIKVTYTPDAPSQGVAELTICNIINLLRNVHRSDRSVREGSWNRLMGVLLREVIIGVIGIGRIGKILCKLLEPFGSKIIACDLKPDYDFGKRYNLEWRDKEALLREADVVSLHIPMNKNNYHFIDRKSISMMKIGSYLLNTSRGPIVEEEALVDALRQKHLSGAYLDVFEKEPYEGPLTDFDNVILTAHIGSSANETRYYMELGAAEDCIKVLSGKEPKNPVPDDEF